MQSNGTFIFPPYLTSDSALPGNTGTQILHVFSQSIFPHSDWSMLEFVHYANFVIIIIIIILRFQSSTVRCFISSVLLTCKSYSHLPMWLSGQHTWPPCAVERDASQWPRFAPQPGRVCLPNNYF